MTLQEWGQVASIVAQTASTAAILAAAIKYYRSRDHQSGETLWSLEERFSRFHASWELGTPPRRMPPITRAIEGEEFRDFGLASALEKGIDGNAAVRDDLEKAWIPRLDELLRFFLIVGAMEKNRLLKRRALWDAYHYWFRILRNNDLIRTYIGLHFPILHRFLAESGKELDRYEA